MANGIYMSDTPRCDSLHTLEVMQWKPLAEDLERRLTRATAYAETIVERAAKLCELRRSEILLMAGEMSAGELRCVQAVMSATAAKIRALAAEGGL